MHMHFRRFWIRTIWILAWIFRIASVATAFVVGAAIFFIAWGSYLGFSVPMPTFVAIAAIFYASYWLNDLACDLAAEESYLRISGFADPQSGVGFFIFQSSVSPL